MREVARVLRPGGRWVFATTHPIRWAFPDDPGPDGLRATMPYWDRTPYVEFAADGTPTYVEHHRTLGDRVREIAAAGFRLVDLVEPEWPAGHTQEWGQWSPLRGAILPGTAIYVCELSLATPHDERVHRRPATRADIAATAELDRALGDRAGSALRSSDESEIARALRPASRVSRPTASVFLDGDRMRCRRAAQRRTTPGSSPIPTRTLTAPSPTT